MTAPGGVLRATIWGTTPPPQAVMWDGLADLMAQAGLAVTSTGTSAWQWRVAPGDLWTGLTSIGNFGVLWRAQSDDVQGRLQAAYDELGAPWRDGSGFAFDVECVLTEARVPRS